MTFGPSGRGTGVASHRVPAWRFVTFGLPRTPRMALRHDGRQDDDRHGPRKRRGRKEASVECTFSMGIGGAVGLAIGAVGLAALVLLVLESATLVDGTVTAVAAFVGAFG